MRGTESKKLKKGAIQEIQFAFTQTIPVMLGYIFLGIAFGLMMQDAGYSFWWAFFSSVFIYAGSMQFVLVTLLTSGASLLYAAVMTLFINGRHLFYGISFIEKFRDMGKSYPYMVFSLTDETYSVLCSLKNPEGMNEKRVSLLISVLDHLYWVTGSVLGGMLGHFIKFDTTGIDFSMTALFVVIVLNQWLDSKEHRPALLGAVLGILCLLLFGQDKFLLPALTFTALILLGVKKSWNMQ
jgi:4-azaleucine resistance transporter AzlC